MAVDTGRVAAPVDPSSRAKRTFRPLGLGDVRVIGGFWADRLQINRARTIPHGYAQLQAAGTLHNFRLAADLATDGYFAWANRRPGAMRVWIPTGEGEAPA